MGKFNIKSARVSRRILLTKGFTIVELMVTIAIAGVLLAIAMPSLNSFLVQMRVDNQVREMQRLMLTARNTAINTGLSTTICPLSGANCTNNWGNEISVFTNTTITTNILDGTDELIKTKAAIEADTNDQLISSSTATLVYTPAGRLLTNAASKFTYCPYGYAEKSNGITVSASGRTYIGQQDSAGKYVDRTSAVFKCP